MSGIRILNRASDSQPHFSGKHSRSSIVEIDFWMPSQIQAFSRVVDRLMRLIQGSQCVPGDEFDVELVLREALENAVVHCSKKDPCEKVRVRCRCGPANEISIVVTDQGRGFAFGKRLWVTASHRTLLHEHVRGIQLMKAFMDDVHFERGGSEVQMHKRARNTAH